MANNERYISTNANITVSRSRKAMNRKTKHSYFHGYLQPLGAPIEVLPGDTIKAKLSAFTRMSTPIVPFIDDIRQEIDAFFVPKRIIWDYTKQFYGEAEEFGIASKVDEPRSSKLELYVPNWPSLTNLQKSEWFSTAFGLLRFSGAALGTTYLNMNTIRAYLSVYNSYFRDENYQYQYKWNKREQGDYSFNLATLGGAVVSGTSFLPKVNKDRDVISSILPYQVKGNPVSLSLGGTAPVIAEQTTQGTGYPGIHSLVNDLYLSQFPIPQGSNAELGVNQGYVGEGTNPGTSTYADKVKYTNLVADLASVASVRVTDLLYAFAYNDFLTRSAHFGTRFQEYIYAMFGCRMPDLSADVPEYLGRMKFNINVQQVVQSTGFSPSSATELGSLGAYSNSGKYDTLFSKSFTEPGYIVLVFYTKHERTYTTGVDRVFLKNELLDYYQPPFGNIPDIPFGSDTIWLETTGDETSLGFQEPWWDYNYLLDRSYGLMNPMLDTLGEIWTLAEKWNAKPTIASAFMMEDREAISRVLATGANGPDYLCDFLLELDATRVMPLYSDGRIGRF